MNYNSWIFWILFAAVIARYWSLNHRRQNGLLLVASYFFYGLWDYRFLFLILLSTAIDYIGGLGVAGIRTPRRHLRNLAFLLISSALLLISNIRYLELWAGLTAFEWQKISGSLPDTLVELYPLGGVAVICYLYGRALPWLYALPDSLRRKYFLTISVIANLAILGLFKYFDFFIESFRSLVAALGLGEPSWVVLGIVLPAGISFYTFQAMSYTIDIYRGHAKPTDNFPDFALFVCFFPHLVAGPIMRAQTLLPQVVNPRRLLPGAFEEGLFLVLLGLFKKIVVADNMASIVNAVFSRFQHDDTADITGGDVLIAIYAFSFQIYGDFSGYSSIARGISKWLGFELTINFRTPYLAVSPADFWRRWHISLSTWLRDYLYIPLGGNRFGSLMTYRNLMITMLLGGMWHGANWTFIIWGFYQGVILCIFRLFSIKDYVAQNGLKDHAYWLMRVIIMFQFTCAGWLLFRADSVHTVWQMWSLLVTDFRMTPFGYSSLAMLMFFCLLLFLFEWLLDGEQRLDRMFRMNGIVRVFTYAYLLFMLIVFPAGQTYDFIYFQF